MAATLSRPQCIIMPDEYRYTDKMSQPKPLNNRKNNNDFWYTYGEYNMQNM